MEFLQHLRRLFAYDDWANRETLESLKKAETPPARSLQLMAHIAASRRLWLGRLIQDGEKVAVWPELSLEESETELERLATLWGDYLSRLTPAKLAEEISYVNTKGQPWRNKVEDILLHVVIHAAYHRGQIASGVRASGNTPAYTDFIHGVRRGLVK